MMSEKILFQGCRDARVTGEVGQIGLNFNVWSNDSLKF